MQLLGSTGIYRTATVVAFSYLGFWLALVLIGELSSEAGARHPLIGASLGGHVPVWWLHWLKIPLVLWLVADLFFIRRVPPEVRKAQWGTSLLAIPLFMAISISLEFHCGALDRAALR